MEYVMIILSVAIVNNTVLYIVPAIFPLLDAPIKIRTAVGMGISMLLVLILSTIISFLLNRQVLIPLNLPFLQNILFILSITILVLVLEMITRKIYRSLYHSLAVYFPVFIIDCIAMGVALLVIRKNSDLVESVLLAAGAALGYGLILMILSGIREQLKLAELPKGMSGIPIALITAGILALAFMGFAGMG